MFTDILYNFISPVTGRILANPNYVLVGNNKGMAVPSPILIDTRLEIANVRKGSNITNAATYVIGSSNAQLPNAQVLGTMDNGFLYNTLGTVSTYNVIPLDNLTDLKTGRTFVGNSSNRPKIAIPPSGPTGPRGFPGFPGKGGQGFGGLAGLLGIAGLAGLRGVAGLAGHTGIGGAAGNTGVGTLVVTTNYDMTGGSIDNVAQSPSEDFSGLTAKWVWDFLNDSIIINF